MKPLNSTILETSPIWTAELLRFHNKIHSIPSGKHTKKHGKIHHFVAGKTHYFDWAMFKCINDVYTVYLNGLKNDI